MRVLVTGAAGFIGSHLCEALLARGDVVVGLDNFDPLYDRREKVANLQAIAHARFTFVEASIHDGTALDHALIGCDAVFHLAARAGVRRSFLDVDGYASTNVSGTADLLSAAERARVQRIVFASSSSVYGNRAPPFREDNALGTPCSPYARTKQEAEQLCHAHHVATGVHLSCVRLFSIYGPRLRPDLAIRIFLQRITGGEPIDLFGTSSMRDYTYVGDAVDGLLRALDRSRGFGIYNIGSARPISLDDLVSTMERILGVRAKKRRRPAQPGDVPATIADLSRARAELGFAPRMALERGLATTARWLTHGTHAT